MFRKALLSAALCASFVTAGAAWDQARGEADPAQPAAARPAYVEPTYVQFRDLFDSHGKPTPKALELSGKPVEIVGFTADPPSKKSPFVVVVGAPYDECPYCTAINEHDHLPYLFVYPETPVQAQPRANIKLRIVGVLDAGHAHDKVFGIHSDLRLMEAEMLKPQRAVRF